MRANYSRYHKIGIGNARFELVSGIETGINMKLCSTFWELEEVLALGFCLFVDFYKQTQRQFIKKCFPSNTYNNVLVIMFTQHITSQNLMAILLEINMNTSFTTFCND